MTHSSIKRGVSLYSFQEEYFLRKLSLENCIEVASGFGAKGIEILGEQMVPGFPKLTDSFVDQWFGWMQKYGTTPTCHDMFLDTKKFKHRLLTPEEEVESAIRDLKFANRLGSSSCASSSVPRLRRWRNAFPTQNSTASRWELKFTPRGISTSRGSCAISRSWNAPPRRTMG